MKYRYCVAAGNVRRCPVSSWMRRFAAVKRIVSVYMLLCLLIAMQPAHAAAENEENSFRYTVSEDRATIVGYAAGEETAIVVPAEIGGYPVTSIGRDAFNNCDNLESITLPASITDIGQYTFHYCKSLTSITIPEGVRSIGDFAFFGCESLESISLPSTVTSVGHCVFEGCSMLSSVLVSENNAKYMVLSDALYEKQTMMLHTYFGSGSKVEYSIPEGTLSIGEKAFYNNYSLEGIVIPGSVTSISPEAFLYCRCLCSIHVEPDNTIYEDIDGVLFDQSQKMLHTFPQDKAVQDKRLEEKQQQQNAPRGTVTSLPTGYFTTGCSYTVPDGTVMIGAYAFYDTNGLSYITIPDGVTSIGDYTFYQCDLLESISLPQSTASIGDYSFAFCTKLVEFIIPEGVISIGDHAFSCCFQLQDIYIPNSVTEIGDDPFSQISYGSLYFTNNCEYRSDFTLWVVDNSYAYEYLIREGWVFQSDSGTESGYEQ